MKKNLKKVISAVLSLALAMSSFVAMTTTTSAATFADVADTASYAEAVNALAAVGAIAGYEDGTFLPDNNITRAEVTTMVVAALNKTQDAKNSGTTSKFADVNEKAAWAAGYVNVGVADGFISGMSATEFAPSENVTYAQVLSMLTRILGYGDFAVARGGWPDGYLVAASAAGILSGVSAATNDAVTRAQVAQLIWNTVQAPMLDITTFTGNMSDTEMQKMDGKQGRAFKTLLSEKFDAYVLDVEVMNTSKTNTSLENDEVELDLKNKTQYNPETGVAVVVGTDDAKANVGKTNAANNVFSSAKTVLEYDDDGEWTVLYFAPTAKVATRAVDGSLINTTTTDLDTQASMVLAINKSKNTNSNPTKYNLSAGTNVYVNGVLYDSLDGTGGVGADVAAIIAAADGDVVLYEDTTSTSGTKYNKIMIDLYAYATVSQVQVKGEDVTVRFSTLPNFGVTPALAATQGASLAITGEKIADGDIVVTVTKNDEAAELTSLVKDDVVAIKGDIMVAGGFANSKTLEVIATDAKVVGKFESYDSDEDIYTVAGTDYEASDAASLSITRAKTYTFKLDPFGKLFSAEEDATSTTYAIVERYVDVDDGVTSSEYSFIEAITMDGQKKTLYIDEDYEATASTTLRTTMGIKDTVKKTVIGVDGDNDGYISDPTASPDPDILPIALQNRIISYTVRNSTGRINNITPCTNKEYIPNAEYNEAASTLGKRIASDAVVLDATEWADSEFAASSMANLDSGVDYDVVLVHKDNAAYKNIIIMRAGSEYGVSTDFVVAAADASLSSATTNEDGDTVYTLRVAGADGTDVLNIAEDAVVYDKNNTSGKAYTTGGDALITRGTVLIYQTDEYGNADRLDVIFDADLDRGDFEELYTAAEGTAWYVPVDSSTITAADWEDNMTASMSGDDEIRVFLAPVVYAAGSSVTFGKISTETTSTAPLYQKYRIETEGANTETFALTEDSNVYSLDLSSTAYGNYQAFGAGAFAGIDVTNTNDADGVGGAYFSATGNTIPTGTYDYAGLFQMAFVMTVNDVITNAVVINN